MTAQLTTFAQSLWRDNVKTGRCTVEDTLRTFCRSVEESDIPRQIDSMPDEMFMSLTRFLSPVSVDSKEIEWPPEVLALEPLELEAFNFDFDAAFKWKMHRTDMIYAAIQQRLKR